ncbi:MAG: glycosyltransferase family 4 protein [Candidatus Nanopelagicales bacterium]
MTAAVSGPDDLTADPACSAAGTPSHASAIATPVTAPTAAEAVTAAVAAGDWTTDPASREFYDQVPAQALSTALAAYARGYTGTEYRWQADRWQPVSAEIPAAARAITAVVPVADLPEPRKLPAMLAALARLAPNIRLLLTISESDPAGSWTKLGPARAWLAGQGGTAFLIDDDHCSWWRDPAQLRLRAGALYGCLGERPLAIAAVAHNGDLGGASRAHIELAKQLQRQGHLVHSLTPGWSARSLPNTLHDVGVATSEHGCHWWAGSEQVTDWEAAGRGVSALVRTLGRIHPDVVLTETAVIPGGALAARAAALPHIWILHERIDPGYGLHPPCPPRDLGEAIRRLSAAVVVNSRFVAESFFPPEVAAECPVAAPISATEFAELRAAGSDPAERSASRGAEPFTVAVIGQISPSKGQSDLVAAAAELRAAGREIRIRVYGWGTAADVSLLRSQIAAAEMTDACELPGHVADLASELRRCDVVAVPSRAEAFGRVAVEAIAGGCPVVYADAGGMAEYMVDGVSGLAVLPGDIAALAAALAKLADDPELRESLVRDGRELLATWLAEHDAATVVARLAGELSDPAGTWFDHALPRLMRADEHSQGHDRGELLPVWLAAGVAPTPAQYQGQRARVASLQRGLLRWAGDPASRRGHLTSRVVGAAARLGSALPGRSRSRWLISARDRLLDPVLVERMLDARWYAAANRLPTDTDALEHFARIGLGQDRPPNEFIDPAWYLSANPDVAAVGMPAVVHYLTMGAFEGRAPGPLFDPEDYLRANPDVLTSDLLPLEHYVTLGRPEGRRF